MHQYRPTQLICRKENCAVLGYYAASSGGPLKMGPIGCPETSVRIYQYSLRNNPDECSPHQRPGVSLKSTAACEAV
jgi:hypothetical protein